MRFILESSVPYLIYLVLALKTSKLPIVRRSSRSLGPCLCRRPLTLSTLTTMAQESILVTQYVSPLTPGSSISVDGLLDGSVTGQCSTDHMESIEVQSRGGSCTLCL